MLSRYNAFNDALSLRNAMDQLFEQSFVNPYWGRSGTQLAPMNVCEMENGYQVDVSLPGVRPEDVEVTVEQNTLTVKGQYSHHTHTPRQQSRYPQGQTQQGQAQYEQEHNWLVQEMSSGSFQRTITFPKSIDSNNIHANFENGVLTINVPISESSRARRITINRGSSQPREVPVEATTRS